MMMTMHVLIHMYNFLYFLCVFHSYDFFFVICDVNVNAQFFLFNVRFLNCHDPVRALVDYFEYILSSFYFDE